MSTILSTEVVPSTSEQQTLLVYDLLDAHPPQTWAPRLAEAAPLAEATVPNCPI